MATLVMRRIYATWSWVILAAVVVQFFLAGMGVFVSEEDFGIHAINGTVILAATLVGAIFALAAREPWRTTGLNALLFVLAVLQPVILGVGFGTGVHVIAAFHVVNGLAVFALAGLLAWRANAYFAAPAAARTAERPAPLSDTAAEPHPVLR